MFSHSCARFQLQTQADLADTLTELVTGIRRVLMDQGLGLAGQIHAIFTLVDAAAPPPEPLSDYYAYYDRPGPGEAPAYSAAGTHASPGSSS
jgi:hypothetical protein